MVKWFKIYWRTIKRAWAEGKKIGEEEYKKHYDS